MKHLVKYILGIVMLSTLFSCEKEKNTFTVNFELTGLDNKMLIMQQRIDGDWVSYDSTTIVDGKATFTGEATAFPEYYYFNVKNTNQYIPFFIEAGNITASADVSSLRSPVVTGSPQQKIYENLLSSLGKFDEKASILSQEYREANAADDEAKVEQIMKEFDQMEIDKANAIKDFAIANNTSVVAPFSMMNYSYMFDLNGLKKVSEALNPSIESSIYSQSLNNRIETLDNVAIGKPFVDFTLNDPDGNPVSLSSVAKGKYVLVDFWASWCGPCRAENPNVVLAYNRFNDKGFDILGVSLDISHDKWIEAIQKDSLTWHHVSDLKYWASDAGKLYGVQSIPHSVLIDPDGFIIAKNLRGEDLQETLVELLGTE